MARRGAGRDSRRLRLRGRATTRTESRRAGRGPIEIHERYDNLSPVHTVNNLALVVWGLVSGADDFSVAIGDTVDRTVVAAQQTH